METRKGFRQEPQPTKGEVLQENQNLKQDLANLRYQFQIMGNIVNQQAMNLRVLGLNMEGVMEFLAASEDYSDPSGAQPGDHLLVDFLGTMLNDDGTDQLDQDSRPVAFEGGYGRDVSFVNLCSNKFVPGFEEQMVGHKVGETFSIQVRFPAEYHQKDMAGKLAKFMISLHSIRRPHAPSPVELLKRELDTAKAAKEAPKS